MNFCALKMKFQERQIKNEQIDKQIHKLLKEG